MSNNTPQEPVRDALYKEIILGNTYGYSRSEGGWSHVVVGTAEKVSALGRVTLKVQRRARYLYGKQASGSGSADAVSIQAHLVFPVNA